MAFGGVEEVQSSSNRMMYIDLRWYPDTQAITLNGKLKDKIGEILYSAAQISGKLTNELKKTEERRPC